MVVREFLRGVVAMQEQDPCIQEPLVSYTRATTEFVSNWVYEERAALGYDRVKTVSQELCIIVDAYGHCSWS
jgi:hypothetical protein